MEKEQRINWIVITALLVVLAVGCFFYFNSTKNHINENSLLQKEIKVKSDSLVFYKNQLLEQQPAIDSLKTELDSIKLANKDSQIVNKYHEKIKVINQYSLSNYQFYFDSLTTEWIKRKSLSNKSRSPRQH
tara:strand:- start:1193 stop:1585 length:393 start_codon:yes stop_codon:yes gene_type:complete